MLFVLMAQPAWSVLFVSMDILTEISFHVLSQLMIITMRGYIAFFVGIVQGETSIQPLQRRFRCENAPSDSQI